MSAIGRNFEAPPPPAHWRRDWTPEDYDAEADAEAGSAAARLRLLRRLLPATPFVIRERYPAIWGGGTGEKRLFRDLRALGAVKPAIAGGEWRLH